MRNSAETVKETDFEITYKDFSTPQVEGIRDNVGSYDRGKTEVTSVGRNFSTMGSYQSDKETFSPKNPSSPQQKNIFQRGFDYMTKTAQESAENPLIGLGAYALAAPALGSIGSALSAAVAPVASNVLQFPTAAKVASAAGTVGSAVLNFPKSAAAESSSLKAQTNYTPVLWNPSTQRVDAVSSATPKVSTTPTIKTAAEKVSSALKNITTPKTTTSTQKLTTQEKRLGKL